MSTPVVGRGPLPRTLVILIGLAAAVIAAAGMKAASRSFPGHFALVPSPAYGNWLTVSGLIMKHGLSACSAVPDRATSCLTGMCRFCFPIS